MASQLKLQRCGSSAFGEDTEGSDIPEQKNAVFLMFCWRRLEDWKVEDVILSFWGSFCDCHGMPRHFFVLFDSKKHVLSLYNLFCVFFFV